MIALIQRVNRAAVGVAGNTLAQIDNGLLALIAIEADDTIERGRRLVDRVLSYRVFEDADGRMNRSLRDVEGGLLLVPQFTLAADTRKGTRAGFSTCAPPPLAQTMFAELTAYARLAYPHVGAGRFGADMTVSLENRGPVTFRLDA